MRMRAETSLLLLIDFQTRLLPAVRDGEAVLAAARRLGAGARALDVPVLASAHCADKIGGLVPALADALAPGAIVAKRHFDALAEPALAARLAETGRRQIVLAGVEAHVCVTQSALGLLAAGYHVFCAFDAMGARDPASVRSAETRLVQAGCVPVTSEMVLFEWLDHADHPAFRAVLELIK